MNEDEIAGWLARMEPCLRRALGPPRSIDSPAIGDELVLLAHLEESERGQARLRELGRHLRKHVALPLAWKQALHAVARLTAVAVPRPALAQSALDALTAFLQHRGTAALAPYLRAHIASSPRDLADLIGWLIEHRMQLDDPLIRDILGAFVPLAGDVDLDEDAASDESFGHALEDFFRDR